MIVRTAASPFFFQAEDGIRELYVTGVQTCALPIYPRFHDDARRRRLADDRHVEPRGDLPQQHEYRDRDHGAHDLVCEQRLPRPSRRLCCGGRYDGAHYISFSPASKPFTASSCTALTVSSISSRNRGLVSTL